MDKWGKYGVKKSCQGKLKNTLFSHAHADFGLAPGEHVQDNKVCLARAEEQHQYVVLQHECPTISLENFKKETRPKKHVPTVKYLSINFK